MPGLEDLNDIYDGGKDKSEPIKPSPRKVTSIDELGTPSSPVQFGQTSNINIEPYLGYLDNGVYANRDINSMRGQRQSVAAKLGLRLANLVPNIVAAGLEMIGYTGALLSEWGDNRNYENAFTEAADSMKNPFGETYRRQEGTWAIGDPTWWIDNVFNLAEMAIPFAGEAALVARGMNAVAKGAVGAFKLGATGSRIARGAGQLTTAGFTAYTEAAMDGASVFDTVYNNQKEKLLNKGLDPDEAHKQATHIAAQSAATTVQLATAMTTLLNLSAIAPYFSKAEDVTGNVLRSEVKKGIGETTQAWLARVKGLQADDFAKKLYDHHGMKKYLKEALQEGGEEIEQYFAQVTGEEQGKEGKTHGFFEQFGQLEKFFDRTMNAEGALAGTLGAFGGVAQTVLINGVIPGKRTHLNEDGSIRNQKLAQDGTPVFKNGQPVYETKWVTPRTYDQWNTKNKFNSLRDSVAEDIKNFGDMQTAYLTAVKKGDPVAAEQARNDMFNVAQVNAVLTGTTDAWKGTYEEIQGMDNTVSLDETDENGPTEAMTRGYAKDRTDNEYSEKAKEAIADLDSYQKEYEKLNTRYQTQFEANEGTKELVDMMFNRKVGLMSMEKLVKNVSEELKKSEDEETQILNTALPEDYDHAIIEYQRSAPAASRVREELTKDLTALNSPDTTPKELARLLRKYQAKGLSAEDTATAIKDVSEKLVTEIDNRSAIISTANDNLLMSSGYNAWLEKNEGKSFNDYKTEMEKKYNLSSQNEMTRIALDDLKARHAIAAKQYAQLWEEKSVATWSKKLIDWNQKLHQARLEAETARRAKLASIKNSKATTERLAKLEANEFAEKVRKERDALIVQLKEAKETLATIQNELKGVKVWDPVKYIPLKQRERQVKATIRYLEDRIKKLDTLYHNSIVNTTTPELEEDDLLNEEDGLEEETDLLDELDEVVTEPLLEEVTGTTLPVDIGTPEDISQPIELNVEVPEQASTESVLPEEDDNPMEQWLQGQTAGEIYAERIMGYDAKLLAKLAEIERQLRDGTIKFSLNLLNNEVKQKMIGHNQAVSLLEVLKEYIDEDQNSESIADIAGDISTTDAPSDIDSSDPVVVEIGGPGIPDTPVIISSEEEDSTTIPINDLRHAGKKINNALSAANSTHEYVEGLNPVKGTYFNVILPGEVNKNLNWDLLLPNGIPANTKIRFEVDIEWKGGINFDNAMVEDEFGNRAQQESSFEDYLDKDGNIDRNKIGEVPIKIVDIITGKTIGYVRRAGYLSAKFEGTADDQYKNWADAETLEEQTALLTAHRELIVNSYENKQVVVGKTLAKGLGTPVLNYDVNKNDTKNAKVVRKLARSVSKGKNNGLLPGKTTIAIVNSGEAKTSKGKSFTGPKDFDTLESPNGTVMTLLPGANGVHFAEELLVMKLSDRETMVQTAVRAIELYLLNDGSRKEIEAEIEKVKAATGFNVGTPQGLKNFIRQYITHLNDTFNESHTSPMYNKDQEQRREQFMMNIWNGTVDTETKVRIHIGRTYTGVFATAKIVNGQLDPTFVSILTQGFAERHRAVTFATDTLRGINDDNFDGSENPFKEILYSKAGTWTSHEYPSYNEYVKSFSKTAIYGRTKAPDGTYVYTANPQLPYEVSTVPGTKKVNVKQNTSPVTVDTGTSIGTTLPVEEFDPTLAEDLMSIMNDEEPAPVTVQEIGSAPANSVPLTMQSLEKLYWTTITLERNGRTPIEVYEELSRKGHTFIPEGYNPFSKCI